VFGGEALSVVDVEDGEDSEGVVHRLWSVIIDQAAECFTD